MVKCIPIFRLFSASGIFLTAKPDTHGRAFLTPAPIEPAGNPVYHLVN